MTVTTGSGGANTQAGDITVANAIAKTAGGKATLALTALNNITFSVGADVTSTTGTLGLTLNATGAISTLRNVNLNGGTDPLAEVDISTDSGGVAGTGVAPNTDGNATVGGGNAASVSLTTGDDSAGGGAGNSDGSGNGAEPAWHVL